MRHDACSSTQTSWTIAAPSPSLINTFPRMSAVLRYESITYHSDHSIAIQHQAAVAAEVVECHLHVQLLGASTLPRGGSWVPTITGNPTSWFVAMGWWITQRQVTTVGCNKVCFPGSLICHACTSNESLEMITISFDIFVDFDGKHNPEGSM